MSWLRDIVSGFFKNYYIYLIVAGFVFGIVMALGTGLYFAYGKLQKVDVQMGRLESTVAGHEATIADLKGRLQDANTSAADLSRRFQAIHEETSKLAKTLSRINLGELANKNPSQVQEQVNKATQDLLREFEAITDPKRLLPPEGDTP